MHNLCCYSVSTVVDAVKDTQTNSMECAIKVHPLSDSPTKAWTEISKEQQFTALKIKNPSKSSEADKVRIVCMSDTHSDYNFNFKIPDGDIFIHAGDFTKCGQKFEIVRFNEWLGSLPHQYKIVISGNHDLTFDENCDLFSFLDETKNDSKNVREYLTNCIYLEDSEVTLFGIKFYGSPWQPEHGGWAFNLPRGEECLAKWNLIPEDTDVLVTHGPPLGHGDLLSSGKRAGCVELLSTVQQRVKPKYHIFGHIHEAYGMSSDGKTVFINASTCNKSYVPSNLPIVFDMVRGDSEL